MGYYLKKYRMFAGKRTCFSMFLFLRDGKKAMADMFFTSYFLGVTNLAVAV
jgi:hypothetical protein